MLVCSLIICYPRKVFSTRANQLIDWLIDLLLSSPKQIAYASNLFLQMVDELCFVFSLPNRFLLVFRLSSGENFFNVAAAKFFASCQLEIKTLAQQYEKLSENSFPDFPSSDFIKSDIPSRSIECLLHLQHSKSISANPSRRVYLNWTMSGKFLFDFLVIEENFVEIIKSDLKSLKPWLSRECFLF